MVTSKVLIYRNPQFSKCPDCKKTGSLHRSRARNLFEQTIRLATIFKIYRCKECGWRGFRSTLIITKKSIKSLALYSMLIFVTAYLARFIILRFVLN